MLADVQQASGRAEMTDLGEVPAFDAYAWELIDCSNDVALLERLIEKGLLERTEGGIRAYDQYRLTTDGWKALADTDPRPRRSPAPAAVARADQDEAHERDMMIGLLGLEIGDEPGAGAWIPSDLIEGRGGKDAGTLARLVSKGLAEMSEDDEARLTEAGIDHMAALHAEGLLEQAAIDRAIRKAIRAEPEPTAAPGGIMTTVDELAVLARVVHLGNRIGHLVAVAQGVQMQTTSWVPTWEAITCDQDRDRLIRLAELGLLESRKFSQDTSSRYRVTHLGLEVHLSATPAHEPEPAPFTEDQVIMLRAIGKPMPGSVYEPGDWTYGWAAVESEEDPTADELVILQGLADLGLIEHEGHSLRLTPAGVEAYRTLSASSVQITHEHSRK